MSESPWRVFYTKPRHEKKSTERLRERGFDVYCPLIKTRVKWSDRWKMVEKPLISGYIFARVNDVEREALLSDPGVLSCLFWLGKPAKVKEEEIETLRMMTTYGTDAKIKQMQPGQNVEIKEGEFEGKRGTIINTSKGEASIRIKSLQLQITVKISTRYLKEIENS